MWAKLRASSKVRGAVRASCGAPGQDEYPGEARVPEHAKKEKAA